MKTIVVEIKHKDLLWKGFYNPANSDYKKGCRTDSTIYNNMKKIVNTLNKKYDYIDSMIVKVYDGKYESYKNNTLLYEYTENDLFDIGIINN